MLIKKTSVQYTASAKCEGATESKGAEQAAPHEAGPVAEQDGVNLAVGAYYNVTDHDYVAYRSLDAREVGQKPVTLAWAFCMQAETPNLLRFSSPQSSTALEHVPASVSWEGCTDGPCATFAPACPRRMNWPRGQSFPQGLELWLKAPDIRAISIFVKTDSRLSSRGLSGC